MSKPPDIADHIRTVLAHPRSFSWGELLSLLEFAAEEIERLKPSDVSEVDGAQPRGEPSLRPNE